MWSNAGGSPNRAPSIQRYRHLAAVGHFSMVAKREPGPGERFRGGGRESPGGLSGLKHPPQPRKRLFGRDLSRPA